jgi:hypothetical protein
MSVIVITHKVLRHISFEGKDVLEIAGRNLAVSISISLDGRLTLSLLDLIIFLRRILTEIESAYFTC